MTIADKIQLLSIILTFIVGIGGWGLWGYISEKRKTRKETDEIDAICRKLELKNHSVFIDLDNLIRDLNTHFHIESKGKEFLLKYVMNIKIKSYKNNLYKLSSDIDSMLKEGVIITEEDLFEMNIDMFDKSFKEYTEFYKNNVNYTPDEVKVLDVFMEKFNIWHDGTVQSTLASIKGACFTKYIKDIKMKQSMINTHYSSAFISTISDLENTADSINGSLTGLEFKGVVI